MTIFQTVPGQIVAFPDPALQCSVQMLGLASPDADDDSVGINFQTQRALVTRLTVSQQVNLQFLHTLGGLIYVYVFGDRMGSVGLSGLAAGCSDCASPGFTGPPASTMGGAEAMLSWYKNVKASSRQSPIRVLVGKTVIEGFVTGFTEDVVDPSIALVQWGAQIAALPED